MTVRVGRRRLVARLPEPARLWIDQGPRGWTAAATPWIDWSTGHFMRPRSEPTWQPFWIERVEGVVHMPPVEPAFAGDRDHDATALCQVGAVPLVQLRPGEVCAVPHVWPVYDVLPSLLGDERASLALLPAESDVVWPLIAGISDDEATWRQSCTQLADAGTRAVLAMAVTVAPTDRQWLAEGRDESAFDRLFHGPAPSEQAFARVAAEHGLVPFLARPPSGHGRTRRNRRLAASLALAGELWLRLGRRESVGQGLLRAARGADDTPYDLEALAEDGNLPVLGWLDETSLRLVEDVLRNSESALVGELTEAYVGAD